MAINRLQFSDAAPMPQPDFFRPLNAIGEAIAGGRTKQAIADVLTASTGSNGKLDPGMAGAALSKIGLTDEARPFLALAQQQAALGQSASAQAEAARHNKAMEDLQRSAQDKPTYQTAQDFGGPTIMRVRPSGAPEIIYGGGQVQGGQPQAPPGSTEPIVPNQVPTTSYSARPAPQGSPAVPQEPPAAQGPAPSPYYNGLPPQAKGIIDDVVTGKRHLTDYEAKDRLKIETAARQAYPGWSPPSRMSPEQAQMDGIRLANGDLTVLQNRGKGNQSSEEINQIRAEATKYLVEKKRFTPEEAAEYSTAKIMEGKQRQAAATATGRVEATRETNLSLILRATDAAIPAALEQAAQVWRTGFIPLNKIIQASGTLITDNPEERKFGMANLQLAEHWARAMNPLGVMRESDRELALKFLATSASFDSYKSAATQLRLQIEREKGAVTHGDTVSSKLIADIENRVKGREGGGAPATGAPAAGTPKVGERKQFKQGWGVWDGTSWVPEKR